MANKRKKKKGGYSPPQQTQEQIVDSIVSIAERMFSLDEPGSLWGDLHKAFLKSEVAPDVAAKIIMHKDLDELRKVVVQLQEGIDVNLEEEQSAELPELTHEEQVDALRCFRKRVKFMKLDRESKLGVGPLSKGKDAEVESMMAPHDYPMEVWLALSELGLLVNDGGGFFHIPK